MTHAGIIEPWHSESERVRQARQPIMSFATIGTLLAMFAVLIGMTPFVKFDRIVSAEGGKIIPVEALSTYQALDPSLIKSVDVREGQQVEAGQLLATLDPTFAKADASQLRQTIAGLDALIARAKAEQDRKPLVFQPTTDIDALNYQMLQRALFDQRDAQRKAQTKSFDEKIKTTQATISRIEADQARLEEREKISHQVEDMRNTLYKSGASSLLNLLQANDSHLELQRTLENDRNSLAESRHQLSALQADRDAFIQGWYTSSSQDLVTAENQRDTAVSSLEKASKHQDLVRLTAAEPSVVLKLSPLSAGSVLKEGDVLMTLMPANAALAAEIRFAARDIGFVRPGNHVILKIDAFNFSAHGVGDGTLQWISEGSFTTDENGKPVEPYYKARVKIDRLDLIDVPKPIRLIPGMTLTADINTGKRSAFGYVMGSLFSGVGEALREP